MTADLCVAQEKFQAFVEKSKAAHLSDAAIAAFKKNYDQLASGYTGLVCVYGVWEPGTLPCRVLYSMIRISINSLHAQDKVGDVVGCLIGLDALLVNPSALPDLSESVKIPKQLCLTSPCLHANQHQLFNHVQQVAMSSKATDIQSSKQQVHPGTKNNIHKQMASAKLMT